VGKEMGKVLVRELHQSASSSASPGVVAINPLGLAITYFREDEAFI